MAYAGQDIALVEGTVRDNIAFGSGDASDEAVRGAAHRHLMPWVPSLHFYFPLGCIAAYKALWELVTTPFYWDKTEHGLSLGVPARPLLPEPLDRPGIELEPRHERL